ncbi:aldehyde dehydrogenase family protein [Yinghuangia seranimata]|uniref:aldehyde dehydrogenase family protein n=1 Tax=Yinghuangia seranimata TaxID=408067 RepID=UPI00248B1880|nr:aldehyde dehydrogenase family protein [Yinghuangia seranimata]MDI2128038.1 aldehyde dehydrogenase family protein [Yinghuangia seranimata]
MTDAVEIVASRRAYVDGKFVEFGVPGTLPLAVSDPATGAVVAEVVAADGTALVERAVRAARAAFDTGPWPRTTVAERVTVLDRMTDHLDGLRDRLVETAIAEAGAPRTLAEAAQVGLALAQARELTGLAAGLPAWEHNELPLEQHLYAPGKVRLSIRRYEPVGVVAAITAYNFPLVTNVVKVFPALAAGCTVVLRPSPLTPLAALVLGDAAAAAGLPPGVLNVVAEAGDAGGVLLSTHPDVDLVSFTGSTAVGRRIAAQGAETLKRLVLELGGKSAGLYLPDALAAGPARAVAGAVAMFASHSGQACAAQTRMLVPQDRKAEVLDALRAAAAALPVGDPHERATVLGPLISEAQRDRVAGLVAASVAAGGHLVTGGGVPEGLDRGWYFAPTVLDVDDNANPAAREEVFGPVLSVQGYRDVDEAVAIANDSPYGLSGGVYTDDLAAGMAVAERMRTGTVQINTGCASGFTPAGGYGQSGLGRERGVAGIRAFQETKHVVVGSV